MAKRKRVLSGMRPTGRLHLGHYFGALANWVRMQEEYDCFYFVADWHALTTHYAEDTRQVPENTLEIATDWLAAGLDPAKCTMFVQSQLLEHAELHLLLSMITPLEWLARVPTYKEQIEQLRDKDLGTYGFLGYPLLQAADIVMYDADLVPVGEDQVPHVELTREIVRRFNVFFGCRLRADLSDQERQEALGIVLVNLPPGKYEGSAEGEVSIRLSRAMREAGIGNYLKKLGRKRRLFLNPYILHEPQVLLTETPRFPGLDGRRMAKSYDNAIWLSDDGETIRTKVRGMMTDPQRVRRTDPGRPEVCPVFAWHKLFSDAATIARVDTDCRTAAIGCVECKGLMAEGLVRWIEPIRARRREYEARPDLVRNILEEGVSRARRVARRTMRRVREAVFGASQLGKSPAAEPEAPHAAARGSSD